MEEFSEFIILKLYPNQRRTGHILGNGRADCGTVQRVPQKIMTKTNPYQMYDTSL